jgi:hypothetical protein
MIWVGRHLFRLPVHFSFLQSKPLLILLTLFAMLIIGLEIAFDFFSSSLSL